MIDAIEKNLNRGIKLLNSLTDEQYSSKSAPPYYSSIGSHMRHILDVFTCIFNGLESVAPKNCDIRKVDSEALLQTWLKVVSDAFADKELSEPDEISLGQSQKKGNHFYLSYIDEIPCAASSLYLEGEVARLGGMGTLVDYRGKGLQTAMIQTRLKDALESGAKVIFSDTQPGNNSQRNLERCGFKLAYVRVIFRKPLYYQQVIKMTH